MDLRSEYEIEELNKRLTKVIEEEYPYPKEELYAAVSKVEITYDTDINTTILIRFGRDCGLSSKENWQKEVEIPLISDHFEFIAGQFTQAIIDKDL